MSGFLVSGAMGPVAMAAASAAAQLPTIAGQQLWLKADAITGLNDGDAIGTWTDSSGNGRNATQGTAGAKPTYKTGIIGGLPVARSDGARWLVHPLAITSASTIFIVVRSSATQTGAVGLFGVSAPTNPVKNSISARANAATWGTYMNSWKATGYGIYDGNPKILVSISDGIISGTATNTLRTNGNSQIVTDTGRYGGDASVRQSIFAGIGGNSPFVGDIAEIIVYDSALSDANQQAVEAYLSAKYGIALA